MRVFDLAKKHGIPSKAVLEILQALGFAAKNHMSVLTEKATTRVTEELARRKRLPPTQGTVQKKTRVLIKKSKSSSVEVLTEPLEMSDVPPVQPPPAPAAPATLHATAVPEKPQMVEPVPHGQTPTPPAATASSAPSAPPRGITVPALPPGPGAGAPLTADRATPEVGIETRSALPAMSPPLARTFPGAPPPPLRPEQPLKPKKAQQLKDAMRLNEPVESPTVWQSFKGLRRREERGREVLRSSATPLGDITKPRKRVIKLSEGLTVKEFAELIGQKPADVIRQLMEAGTLSTINQPMDLVAAVLIAERQGLKAEVVEARTETELLEEAPEDPAILRPRPPVVTIMGHVDHGKTSLLDAIRETKVTQQEAGGITQHIGAYAVDVGTRRVVFLDTPGHEAFTAMRARGAQLTDIVVLVVAADDGVMPQTIEAIAHARAADVPLIVAVNKIDKPEANVDRVTRGLADQGLIPEAWGGKTIFAEVSAKKKTGLDHLLEMILLQAEVLELRANPDCQARGTIVEARMDRGHGPVATVLVQKGTLRVGESCVSGAFAGRVRALMDHLGRRVESAGPAAPAEVIGLSGVPEAGDSFIVVEDEHVAKEIALTRRLRRRAVELSRHRKMSLEDLFTKIREGTVKELPLIVKADVQGSAEVLKDSLQKVADSPAPVKVRVLHCGVGGITETDVLLASASNAIIIGFNVRPDPTAAELAEREKVEIRLYDVIYDVMKSVRAAMEGLLEPVIQERVVGRAEVRQVFKLSKAGVVAGSYVVDGTLVRAGASARVHRGGAVIFEGKMTSLKRFKDDVREVQTGYECGIGLEQCQDIQAGDIIEVYLQDKVAAKLEAPRGLNVLGTNIGSVS